MHVDRTVLIGYKKMWDERYKEDGFAYGIEPNSFLVEQVSLLGSPILSLGEGEGRNAGFSCVFGTESPWGGWVISWA